MLRIGVPLFGLWLMAASMLAYAADKPAEIQPYIHATAPYGSGKYNAFLMTIYDADLWTDAPQWSWNTTFALSLHYHIDIKASDLSDKSIKEMKARHGLREAQAKSYAQQLAQIFPDVHEGDEITALYIPQTGLRFYHNAVSIGAITDPVFAQQFLSIWLSEKTSDPRLRKELLALSDSNTPGEEP